MEERPLIKKTIVQELLKSLVTLHLMKTEDADPAHTYIEFCWDKREFLFGEVQYRKSNPNLPEDIDYSLEWPNWKFKEDLDGVPPSKEEVEKTMEELRKVTRMARPDISVVCISCRHEVAEFVQDKINLSHGPSTALVNIGGVKEFRSEKGYYESELYVAVNNVVLNDYIDHF